MLIAISQLTTDPGKLAANAAKLAAEIARAKTAGAELVVFPELALPGYCLMDLALDRSFLQQQEIELGRLAASCTGICAIVGCIDAPRYGTRAGGRPLIYNSAAVLMDGSIAGHQHKSLLPTYDIFFEERYFAPARERRIFEIGGRRIGIQICEDLWDDGYSVKVCAELAERGAEIIVNLSASPFHLGKEKERLSKLESITSSFGLPFVYANLIGAFDGYEGEIVFDGGSLALNARGQLLARAKDFDEDFLLVDTDASGAPPPSLAAAEEQLRSALALGISEFFRRQRFSKAYVGLSGGIDSAVTAWLAAEALSPERVVGVTMPSHITSSETRDDALRVAEALGIKCEVRPISPEYGAWASEFERATGGEPGRMTKQNKQARIRGSILMEYANQDPGSVVLSTGNKTEVALGYCTLYGDMCGALAPLSDVNKHQVYELARHCNHRAGREIIPFSTIERVPTAELEPGQSDRDNLPADYPVLSPLVQELVESSASMEDLVERYPEPVVRSTMRLLDAYEFKRRQAAPGIRVSKKSFGVGRRFPMGFIRDGK